MRIRRKDIPIDIIRKLKFDFEKEAEYLEALELINAIRNDNLNVGWIQLSRAVMIIANGDISKMKQIIESGYYGDPRDVIMEMMNLKNYNNEYGLTPFNT